MVVALAGNKIAQLLEMLVADLRQHELAVAFMAALSGMIWGLIHRYRQPKVTL